MMDEEPADPLGEDLGYWLFRLNRAVHAAFTRRLATLGVSVPEWVLLALVNRRPETPANLADGLGIDRAAVTRVVGQLESKGLIRRVPHCSDGRSTVLQLTCEAARLLPSLVAASRATHERFLGHLPEDQAKALIHQIRDLAERQPPEAPSDELCPG